MEGLASFLVFTAYEVAIVGVNRAIELRGF